MWEHFSPFGYCVFGLLMLLSCLSWYLIVVKTLEIMSFSRDFSRVKDKWHGLLGFGAISAYVQNDKSPLVNLMTTAAFEWAKINMTQVRDSEKEDLLSAVLSKDVRLIRNRLGRGLTLLGLIAAVSPFIGLLGTVVGIYETLTSLTISGGAPSLGVISQGIGETLIMTAFGLLVAIPAVCAWNLLSAGLKNCSQNLQDLARAYHTLLVHKIKSHDL